MSSLTETLLVTASPSDMTTCACASHTITRVGGWAKFVDAIFAAVPIGRGYRMPRLDSDVKLDFKDVLVRPKRSTLKSRSEVSAITCKPTL